MISLGLVMGPAAAIVMTLPVEAARPEKRALAMGLYFATYYVLMGVAPAVLGLVRDASGSAAGPLWLSAAVAAICLPLWALFRGLQARGANAS